MVNLTIDGKKIKVDEGTTILQAAEKNDIKIPSLCFHPLLEPYAACRVCVVEVIKKGESEIVTSCNTKVTEGIEVKTDSERAMKARELNVEMLLAQAPDAEAVQELAKDLGIKETRFEVKDPDEKCILCGLCVRACEEVVGADAISFNERGAERTVSTPFGQESEACIGCTACSFFCPTGAITVEDLLGREVIHDELHLGPSSAVRVPIRQAVPMVPFIDEEACIHFKTGECKLCEQVCEKEAVDHDMEDEEVKVEVGSVVLASGFKPFDAKRIQAYGYGRFNNVITALEFEKLVNASGPTGGKIRLANGKEPESVGIVHCVGSRDENYNEYCSRVCCMYSLKFAHLLNEKTNAQVYDFYIDMRCFGKGYEEFYHRLLEEGTKFIRGRVSEITDVAVTEKEEGKLVIRVEDTLIGAMRRIPVDMVVLSIGLEPGIDQNEIARVFNISCSQDTFFLERHPKLGPVSTFSDGIFLAGACQSPKDIPDTVAQAGAAASEALSLADKGTFELEPVTAEIDKDLCSGCQICVSLCPFTAITYNEEEGISEINDALCKGCGTCVSACPSGASQQRHYRDNQIFAEIEGIFIE
ncbi:MAG: 4Fe-4S dicluster domain-containing protein [Candidatus Aminicenantes bacterium]|nr:4Fe-4S dicluster domain-containing protein [Candidatus Aminicenantes bacterium]